MRRWLLCGACLFGCVGDDASTVDAGMDATAMDGPAYEAGKDVTADVLDSGAPCIHPDAALTATCGTGNTCYAIDAAVDAAYTCPGTACPPSTFGVQCTATLGNWCCVYGGSYTTSSCGPELVVGGGATVVSQPSTQPCDGGFVLCDPGFSGFCGAAVEAGLAEGGTCVTQVVLDGVPSLAGAYVGVCR